MGNEKTTTQGGIGDIPHRSTGYTIFKLESDDVFFSLCMLYNGLSKQTNKDSSFTRGEFSKN